MRDMLNRLSLAALLLAGASCAAGAEAGSMGAPDGALGDCYGDGDCPTGLVCVNFTCVTDGENLPPETEDPRTFLRPAASSQHLYALSPEGDSVAVIDPVDLSIESVVLPDEPIDLAIVPGADEAVIVSRQGRALSLLGGGALAIAPTSRAFDAISLSPSGRWAILWTPDGVIPDAGAEGIVGVADVAALRDGASPEPVERAAGRRHTDVFFHGEEAAAIVGKGEIVVIDLSDPDLPTERIALPDAFAETTTREAIASADGAWVILRSLASSELAVLDVAARTLGTLALPAPATDLDLAPDGSQVVAALRSTAQVAWFPLPAGLGDPGLIQTAAVELPGSRCETEEPCVVSAGQVSIAPDGSRVALFTNAQPTESFGVLELATGAFDVFERLEKQVETVAIGPDGASAVVLHRANPDSTVADLYEQEVDKSQGYSVVDLAAGTSQLKLTAATPPLEVVFTGRFAAVTLRGEEERDFRVDAIDLETQIAASLPLASGPRFAGVVPGEEPRVWVTQEHPAGRISFVDVSARTVRTVTGYELNSEIE